MNRAIAPTLSLDNGWLRPWLLWVVSTTVLWTLARAIDFELNRSFFIPRAMTYPLLLSIAISASGLAAGQWLVLRRWRPQASLWIVATVLAYLLSQLWSARADIFLQFGLLLGIGQWLVLRRWINRAWLWILVSTLAFILAAVIIGNLFAATDEMNMSALILLLFGTHLLYAAVTGLGLVWLRVPHNYARPFMEMDSQTT